MNASSFQDQDAMTMLSDSFVPWEGIDLSCRLIDKMIDSGVVDQFNRKETVEEAEEGVRWKKSKIIILM
jgi:aromatic ring hydroxylase